MHEAVPATQREETALVPDTGVTGPDHEPTGEGYCASVTDARKRTVSTIGYGHADDLARQPPWYMCPDARKALAERDIGAVYRLLYRGGVSQQEIARRTRQSQSEVWEIMHSGRQVRDITVLERIADGLGVLRPFLRLLEHAPGGNGAYGGEVTVTETSEEVGAEMLRRHLIALGGVAVAGATVAKLGELLAELPGPPPLIPIWRPPGSCGGPPVPTPTVISTGPPRNWRCATAGSTLPRHWPRPRYAAGRAAA